MNYNNVNVGISIHEKTLTGITAKDVSGYADGREYTVAVAGVPEGAQVVYRVGETEYDEAPVFTEAGSREVIYTVTKPYHTDVTGMIRVVLQPMEEGSVVVEGYEGIWDGSAHEITVYKNDMPETQVIYYHTDESDVETTVAPTFMQIGTHTVYYRVVNRMAGMTVKVPVTDENGNIVYETQTGQTIEQEISSGSVAVVILGQANDEHNISINGYTGTYDGTAHNAVSLTGDLTGLTVDYYENEALLDVSGGAPTVKDAGERELTVVVKDSLGAIVASAGVTASVARKQLSWDTSALAAAFANMVVLGEDNRTIDAAGITGALKVTGAVDGEELVLDNPTLSASLLSGELGNSIAAMVRFTNLSLAGGAENYLLPEGLTEYSFRFTARHLQDHLDTMQIGDQMYDPAGNTPTLPYPYLIEDVDYRVVWDNNIGLTQEGAVATATVTGIGLFAGQSAVVSFRIVPRVMNDRADQVGLDIPEAGLVANGHAFTPAVTISGLEQGRDYTVSYEANTEPGTATVTVTFTGIYTGSVKKQFTIAENAASAARAAAAISAAAKANTNPTDDNIRAAQAALAAVSAADQKLLSSATRGSLSVASQNLQKAIAANSAAKAEAAKAAAKKAAEGKATTALNAVAAAKREPTDANILAAQTAMAALSDTEKALLSAQTKAALASAGGDLEAARAANAAAKAAETVKPAEEVVPAPVVEKPIITFKNKTVTKKLNKAKTKTKTIQLKRGKKLKLQAKASTNGKITYTSSKKKVASVNKKGVIKAVKKGKVTISVKCGTTVVKVLIKVV